MTSPIEDAENDVKSWSMHHINLSVNGRFEHCRRKIWEIGCHTPGDCTTTTRSIVMKMMIQ